MKYPLIIILLLTSSLQLIEFENLKLRKSNPKNLSANIDTLEIMNIVSIEILERLENKRIKSSGFDDNGDFYVEYTQDSSSANPNDLIWEYYQVRKSDIIIGNLNKDGKIDFAIQSFWGVNEVNMFKFEWHIYYSSKKGYNSVKNDFGGRKFSDIETVKTIENFKIKTEFQKWEHGKPYPEDSIKIREYKLINEEIVRID